MVYLTLNKDKTLTTDLPDSESVSCSEFSNFGSMLDQLNVGIRIKPTNAVQIAMYIADVFVEAEQRSGSTFLRVNEWNNNAYETDNKVYRTLLEFSDKFSSTDKSGINIATAAYDLGIE